MRLTLSFSSNSLVIDTAGTVQQTAALTPQSSRSCLVRSGLVGLLFLAAWLLGTGAAAAAAVQTTPSVEPPTALVFVPGVTGSRLEDPVTGETLWGDSSQVFAPKDRGYSTVLPIPEIGAGGSAEASLANRFVATDVLSHLKVFAYTREVYRPLRRFLEGRGHRTGDLASPKPQNDLYFFAYDWRQKNLTAVVGLHAALERLAQARRQPAVTLLCQSNAGRICRYVAKYGDADPEVLTRLLNSDPDAFQERLTGASRSYRVQQLILISNSHGGSLRQLHELHRGRKYVPAVGRFMGPETLFALRTLFEDLPFYRDDLFLGTDGVPMAVDLFDAESWHKYGWSIFAPEIEARLAARNPGRLFAERTDRLAYLEERLKEASQTNRLLITDSPVFTPELCLLQNTSLATIERAVLAWDSRRSTWRLLFAGDRGVPKELLAKLTSPGDGHGTVTSQSHLSAQEHSRTRQRHAITGGHFDTVTKAATLHKIGQCLSL